MRESISDKRSNHVMEKVGIDYTERRLYERVPGPLKADIGELGRIDAPPQVFGGRRGGSQGNICVLRIQEESNT